MSAKSRPLLAEKAARGQLNSNADHTFSDLLALAISYLELERDLFMLEASLGTYRFTEILAYPTDPGGYVTKGAEGVNRSTCCGGHRSIADPVEAAVNNSADSTADNGWPNVGITMYRPSTDAEREATGKHWIGRKPTGRLRWFRTVTRDDDASRLEKWELQQAWQSETMDGIEWVAVPFEADDFVFPDDLDHVNQINFQKP